MFLELLLAITLGIAAGIVTGLTPGIHINLVAALLFAFAPLLPFSPIALVSFIIGMAITHNFLDMIPAVFLGAPDDATALGVLPGHRYLLHGQGLMAIKLTILGGIFGSLLVIVLFRPEVAIIGFLAATTKHILFWIILAMVIFTIAKDKKRPWAFVVFMLSGVVGAIALRLPLDEPLLPLLSGIFGVATLLYSIKDKNAIPEQADLDHTDFDVRKTVLGSFLGSVGALITAIFPGVSSAMAAALVSRGGKLGDHGFMVLIGALGSASFILSLAAFLAIDKARNGAMAIAVQLASVDSQSAWLLLSGALLATGIAALLTLGLARKAARFMPKLPYAKTCIGVIVFVTGIVALRTGWLGLLVLCTSTAVGLLPASLKTARAQAMGCLLLPLLIALW